MKSFWDIANRVIREADIILEVLDARMIDETRNLEIEDKVIKAGKKLIYVLNKADLLTAAEMKKRKRALYPCVFVSAQKHQGTIKLREMIKSCARTKGQVTVGVLGYPNTGKSALINALKGKASAPTSSQSGYTRAIRKVSAGGGIMLLDTPGVIPYKEKEQYKHALISAVDPSKVKEPDLVVAEIINNNPGLLEEFYEVQPHKNPVHTIEDIARKKGKLKKGGVPDTEAMARIILRDYHKGKIRAK